MVDAVTSLKARAAGEPFAICPCGAVPDWDGMGDYHWVKCEACGEMSGSFLDPPDAKADWNRRHKKEQP